MLLLKSSDRLLGDMDIIQFIQRHHLNRRLEPAIITHVVILIETTTESPIIATIYHLGLILEQRTEFHMLNGANQHRRTIVRKGLENSLSRNIPVAHLTSPTRAILKHGN